MKALIIPLLLLIAWAIFRWFFADRVWGYILSMLGWAYREKVRPKVEWGLKLDYLILILWVLIWFKYVLWSWPLPDTESIIGSFVILVFGFALWANVTGRVY